jgi:hypothetical protein
MLRPIIAIVAAAFIALAFTATEASARGGFHGGGFHGGFHGGFRGGFGFRRFGPGIGLGLGLGYGLGYPYYAGYYPYYAYDGCIRPRRVWTPYGWQIRPVNVCRYYGYY